MNNYTEQQIEEQLKQLASANPGEDSLRRTDRHVRNIIFDTASKPVGLREFFYYAAVSAAILLIGIGLLYQFDSSITIPLEIVRYDPTEPSLTLAKLNTVFQNGGQKALDEYFEKAEAKRDAQPETLTLQELIKEL